MESDLEKFISLYKSLNIDLVKKNAPDGTIYLELEAHGDKKLVGYMSFYSRITFNKEGKFIEQGFYE